MFQSFIWLLTAPIDRFSRRNPNRPPSIPVDWERCQSTKNIRFDFLSTGTRWHIMMRDRAETPTPIAPSRAYAVESGKHDQAETAEIEYSLADIRGIRRNSGPARDTCTYLFFRGHPGQKEKCKTRPNHMHLLMPWRAYLVVGAREDPAEICHKICPPIQSGPRAHHQSWPQGGGRCCTKTKPKKQMKTHIIKRQSNAISKNCG